MGNTEQRIYQEAKSPFFVDSTTNGSLSSADLEAVSEIGLTLRKLAETEFDLLLSYGYEVANATLRAYCEEAFANEPLGARRCGRES